MRCRGSDLPHHLVLIGVVLIGLSGCSTLFGLSPAATSTPAPGVAASTPAAAAPATVGLRQVHSPGTVAADLQLQAGECHPRVIDGKAGIELPDSACTPGAIDPA
ncbi:hypothetical protein [Leifsonia sp. 2MCAF36]|uniref:hypothetical protein n=1 Tax=Leifsonia sp. 2MCAF36 TaxID=3232988 RepID=UPI003F988266